MVHPHQARSRDGDAPFGAKLRENRARQARENRLENSGYLPGLPPGTPAFWLQRGKFDFLTVIMNTPNTLQTIIGEDLVCHRVIFVGAPAGPADGSSHVRPKSTPSARYFVDGPGRGTGRRAEAENVPGPTLGS